MNAKAPEISQKAGQPDDSLAQRTSEAGPVLDECLLAGLKPTERRLVIQFQTGHPRLTTEQAIKDLREAGM